MSINSRALKIHKNAETDEQALERLRRTLQQDPRSMAFVPLSELCRRHGHYDEAIAVCTQGLHYHPGYATAHLALARARRAQGDIDRACQDYEKVILLVPDNVAARYEGGEVEEARGDLAKALTHFEAARAHGYVAAGLDERIARLRAALASASVASSFEAYVEDEPHPNYEALSRAWLLRRRIDHLRRYLERISQLSAR